MPNEFVASSAQAASSGGLVSGLTTVGTAAKAFVLANPMGLVLVGGVLIGAGAYWVRSKAMANEAAETAEADEAVEPAEPAEPA